MTSFQLGKVSDRGEYEEADAVYLSVKDYYGEVLSTTADLKTSACTATDRPHPTIRRLLKNIPIEVMEKFYGCGTPIPLGIDGIDVLDLGSGSGRDCYVAAALVGERGSVTGVDMTAAQLDVARKHADKYCRDALGYRRTNMRFLEGFIECLDRAGVESASMDLVMSNCVLNLSPNKRRVLAEAFRVLRPGGEFLFSDVFCDRRLGPDVRSNPVLLGECIAGALYVNDFLAMCKQVGFGDPRRLGIRSISITDPDLLSVVGSANFFSIEWRLFKIAELEPNCEDYGHVAVLNPSWPGGAFCVLDEAHRFEAHKPERVCGNTAHMLSSSRLGRFFSVTGSFDRHFGGFPCAPAVAQSSMAKEESCGSCVGGSCSS